MFPFERLRGGVVKVRRFGERTKGFSSGDPVRGDLAVTLTFKHSEICCIRYPYGILNGTDLGF